LLKELKATMTERKAYDAPMKASRWWSNANQISTSTLYAPGNVM
jgi:hypothetical protein